MVREAMALDTAVVLMTKPSPRTGRPPVRVSLVGAVVFGFTSALVLAAPSARASNQQSAQQLAANAIDCLKRGEDAITTAARLAAYREGLAYARQALAEDETNADAHFAVFGNYGRILLVEGTTPNPFNLVEVTRELDRALQLNPNHADALAAKGGLYRQLPRLLGGDLDKAEAYLTRAIDLDPNAVGARIELAATYRDKGESERAVPLLQKAAEVAERQGKFRQLVEARSLLHDLESAH